MSIIRRFGRPSPALVLAFVGLVLATAGSATAARLMITSSTQIRNGVVTSADIKTGTIRAADINPATRRALRGTASGVPAGSNGSSGASGTDGQPGPQGPPGPPGSGAISSVALVTSAAATTTSSTSFEDLPTATAVLTVPEGQTVRLRTRFTAESSCFGADAYCNLRVLVDGVESAPIGGTGFAFDSSDNNTETSSSWEGHSMERVSAPLGAGDHTVTVQRRVTSAALDFRLDDWVLSVDAIITA